MKSPRTNCLSRCLPAGLLAMAIASAGCDIAAAPFSAGLEAFSVSSTISARLTRADGSVIPDVIAEIQEKYGFSAQKVVFMVPEVYMQMTSAPYVPAEALTSEMSISAWSELQKNFGDDVGAFNLVMAVAGIPISTCGSEFNPCDMITDFQLYMDHFARQATEGIRSKLSMYILDGVGNSVELKPKKVEFDCVFDETLAHWVQGYNKYKEEYFDTEVRSVDGAVKCAGSVSFALDGAIMRSAGSP